MGHDARVGTSHDDALGSRVDRSNDTVPASALASLTQRRRVRALVFYAGLLCIVVPGVLWAASTKDPIRGVGFDGPVPVQFGFENEEFFFEEQIVPATSAPDFSG